MFIFFLDKKKLWFIHFNSESKLLLSKLMSGYLVGEQLVNGLFLVIGWFSGNKNPT